MTQFWSGWLSFTAASKRLCPITLTIYVTSAGKLSLSNTLQEQVMAYLAGWYHKLLLNLLREYGVLPEVPY